MFNFRFLLRFFLPIICFGVLGRSAGAEESAAPLEGERKNLTRIQIFLDANNFPPGRLDGRWGEFTRKAAARFLESKNKPIPSFGEKPLADLDLPIDQARPVFIDYTVTSDDVSKIGEVAEKPVEQAKQKSMPYTSVLELVAERFHSDPDFLRELNPGADLDGLEQRAVVKVPNIDPPFDIDEVPSSAKSKGEEKPEEQNEGSVAAGQSGLRVNISVDEKMLEVREGERLLAAFPITPGSEALPAPKGEWKITEITWMPWFRYDEEMLEHGERSDEAHNIPPGPNNAVGIVWMALNKKGIGIHGTNNPDTIGRSASHGCIRLANWDAWKLGHLVSADTPVTIN